LLEGQGYSPTCSLDCFGDTKGFGQRSCIHGLPTGTASTRQRMTTRNLGKVETATVSDGESQNNVLFLTQGLPNNALLLATWRRACRRDRFRAPVRRAHRRPRYVTVFMQGSTKVALQSQENPPGRAYEPGEERQSRR
jgi:hypothetical protein